MPSPVRRRTASSAIAASLLATLALLLATGLVNARLASNRTLPDGTDHQERLTKSSMPEWLTFLKTAPVMGVMEWVAVLVGAALCILALAALVLVCATVLDTQAVPRPRQLLAALADFFWGVTNRPLFQSQSPQPVRNPLVHRPVKIIGERLSVSALQRSFPELAPYVADLPVGMGIKGGIARKLVKAMEGNPEPASSFDIDVTIFTETEVTPEVSQVIREKVTGLQCGGLAIEAQDVELRPRASVAEYFITRDITQNEVLIIKTEAGSALLLFTEDCRTDCREGRATPSVRGLTAGLTMVWDVDERGSCRVAEHILSRTIIRFLKGHATSYGVDEDTWTYYRDNGLSSITLFKILKHFHDDDHKYQAAVDHLIREGLLSRRTIRELGGANALWGHLIQEVNSACSRYGGRLKFTDLDPEAVEKWIAQKKAKLGDKLVHNTWRARRIGFIPVDEDVCSLGILFTPKEMEEFQVRGVTYVKNSDFPELPPVVASSVQVPRIPVQRHAGSAGSSPATAGASLLADRSPPNSEGILRQHSGSGASNRPANGRAGIFQRLRTAATGRERVENDALAESTVPLLGEEPTFDGDLRSVGDRPLTRSGSQSFSNREQTVARRTADVLASGGDMANHTDKLEVGFFELANPDLVSVGTDPDARNGPFALVPTSYGVTSTITRLELLQFIIGVVWPYKAMLLLAYVLLLSGVCFRVLTSKYEGDTLNALQAGGQETFTASFKLVALVWSMSLAMEMTGNAVMQVFARKAMQRLFSNLFSHLINQDIELFKHLTVGEVSARCSGDSLTLKAIITFTVFSIVSGSLQAFVALSLLTYQAMVIFTITPLLALAAPLALFVEVAYSIVFGALIAHPLNHTARRSLGRMYGFLFDTFSQIPTVQSLGLLTRQTVDYCKFVEHYWRNRLNLDLWLVFEGGFTSAVGIALTLGFLRTLGNAYFEKAVFGIGTIYTILKYVQFMQHGVKMASDGWARMSASLGSVERLVELHNFGHLVDQEGRPAPRSAASRPPPVDGSDPPNDAEAPQWQSIGKMTGSFRLVDCVCSYPYKTDVTVLHGVSLEVRSGSAVAVHGASGSGKSTILRMSYLRLLPFKGHVDFEVLKASSSSSSSRGAAVEWKRFSPLKHNAMDIRHEMAVCSLETLGTFFASVETNVACAAGTKDVSSADVRDACAAVGLDDVVYNKLNDGYFTPIGGPSGVALNNDLLVRLSLARALVRKPKILLFDESDHFAYVVGISLLKRVIRQLCDDGCAVLMSVWNLELAKELVIAPPEKPGMKLIHILKDGRLH